MLTFFIYNLPKSRFTLNPVTAQKRMMAKLIFKGLATQGNEADPDAVTWNRKFEPNQYFLITSVYKTAKAETEAYNKTIQQLSHNIKQKTKVEEEMKGKKSKIKLPEKLTKSLKEKTEMIALQTSQASAMSVAGIFYSLYSTEENESFNNYDMFNEKEKKQIIKQMQELSLPFVEMTKSHV